MLGCGWDNEDQSPGGAVGPLSEEVSPHTTAPVLLPEDTPMMLVLHAPNALELGVQRHIHRFMCAGASDWCLGGRRE